MIGDSKLVDSCLAHNGSLYVKTENIEGQVVVDVCQLEETEACACKYFQHTRVNDHSPIRLCLYEVMTYKHPNSDILSGEDFIMKQGEEQNEF